MKTEKRRGVFIVWKVYQRRVEVLAPRFDLKIFFIHYPWEEKSKFYKTLSYFLKTFNTFKYLYQSRPSLVFFQLPPTLVLYCVGFYSWLTGSKYVADCHNSMVYSHWYKWLLVKNLLSKGIMIVHNDHVAKHVEEILGIKPFVLRTGIVIKQPILKNGESTLLKHLGLSPKNYVILPWNIASDEPLEEVLEAMKLLPDIQFVMTWYFERLSNEMRKHLPSNLKFTGFLEIDDFNQLFANAGVALVLTNREGTQLSGVHEAMAFEIPAVVSDLITPRFLYKDAPIYVRNEPESIAEGVKSALEKRLELKKKLKDLRIETEKEFYEQIKKLRAILDLPDNGMKNEDNFNNGRR